MAAGGNLSPGMLLSAYEQGIFPWYSEGEPILWHSPEPRFVLFPDSFHLPKSVKRRLNRGDYTVTFDRDFRSVIRQCKVVSREGQDGTWITDEMEEAYRELHRLGYAHSVEVWSGRAQAGQGDRVEAEARETPRRQPGESLPSYQGLPLAGGLYGVSLGNAYFGESMFSLESDASKVGFVALARKLFEVGFAFIDSQVHTEHVARFGATEIPREEYLKCLAEALEAPTHRGVWTPWEAASRAAGGA